MRKGGIQSPDVVLCVGEAHEAVIHELQAGAAAEISCGTIARQVNDCVIS